MLIRTSLIAAALIFCSMQAGAQNRYSQKLYAFKETGTSTAVYHIYVELTSIDTPIWHTAFIGTDSYSVHPTLIQKTPVIVGERKIDKRLVKIRPQVGNRLWKLEFNFTRNVIGTEVEPTGTVVLEGIFKNKKITSAIRQIVELERN